MSFSRRVSSSGLVVILAAALVAALAAVASPLWGRWRTPPAPPMAPGDTVNAYGPRTFTTPNGASTNFIERLDITPQIGTRYLLKVENGVGGPLVSIGTITLGGNIIISTPDLNGSGPVYREMVVTGQDTLRATIAGSAGANIRVTVLAMADPYVTIHQKTYIQPTGMPMIVDDPITRPPGVTGPYLMFIQNGNANGTQRIASGTMVLSTGGSSGSAAFTAAQGTLVNSVTVGATGNLRVTTASFANTRVSVRITGRDVGAPVLTIASPAPDTVTNQAQVTVTGTVQDATATTVTVNGQVATRNGANYSATVTLAEGSNTLAIVATDAAGNHTDSTRTVVRDSQAPTLTVTAPTDGFITGDAQVAVTGSVSDATALTVNVNGSPVTPDGSGAFTTQVALNEGTNFITVTAIDGAGNATSVARQVVRDTQAPVVTVTAPADNAVTNAGTVHVTGTVTDATATTVTVNGTATPVTGGAFDAEVALGTEGPNAITVVATDAAGNAMSVSRSVIRDTQAPALVINAPADGFITRYDTITVSGSTADANAVTVSANGIPLPVDGAGQFSGVVSLMEGANVITVIATDAAGNTTTRTRTGTSDRTAPALAVTSPTDGLTTSQSTVSVTGTVSDATAVSVTVNGNPVTVSSGAFAASVTLNPGPNTIAVVATDAATNVTSVNRSVTRNVGSDPLLVETLPMDNTLGAPPPAAGVATNVSASTRFIYEGPNAVQTGVQPGAIQPLQVAVIRGRVTDASGAPLSGVTVKATGRPELGSTLTRANGLFDLAVNGFGPVGISYSKTGYLNVARQLTVAPLDYTPAPEVVMTALDTIVTAINFTAPIEVARGSQRSDADGARTQRLLFQQGTTVKMVMANGDSVPLTGPIHVRATEYTVGLNGQKAMPAQLPVTSGYTYAVELSVDEAMAAGANTVSFSKPVFAYNENFLNLPPGFVMPAGYYDAAKRAWVAAGNGRVVKIHAITGGVATLDVNGTGPAHPDTLTAMGVTTAELEQLAQLYSVNQTLWRVPIPHFSAWDFNTIWVCELIGMCEKPPVKPKNDVSNSRNPANNPGDRAPLSNCKRASIINCQQQTLGEMIPILGTPYSLYYQSDRMPGYRAANVLSIPLTNDPMVTSPDTVKVEISVAGRKFMRAFLPTPGLRYRFEWDGLDAYGRTVIGRQPVTIRVGYGYAMDIPIMVNIPFVNAFGVWDFYPALRRARATHYLWTEYVDHIGPWDNRGAGLGGWTIGDQHVYEVTSRRVVKGNGGEVQGPETVRAAIRTVAGIIGQAGLAGDGGPATKAQIAHNVYFEFGHDGALYLPGIFRIRRVGTDGIIQKIAGSGTSTSSGDGGHAQLAGMNPAWPQFLPDGSMIFFDLNLSTIRRIGPDSIVRRWAGGGASTAEEAQALQTSLVGLHTMQSAPEGSVYFVQGHKVRQITPGGLVYTVAGTGTCNASAPVEGAARQAQLCIPVIGATLRPLAIGPDGSLYLVDLSSNRVRRIWTDGRISHYAFGSSGSGEPGQPAMNAVPGLIRSIHVGPDGTLYWQDSQSRIRAVSPEGIILPVAGNGIVSPITTDGALATMDFAASAAHDMRTGPDGALYVGEAGNRVRRIGSSFGGLAATDHAIASQDASEVYVFTGDGRHKKTVDGTTGITLVTFGYDSTGKLTSIMDRDSLVTTIERDANGKPATIVAPFGQRTQLTVDNAGLLASLKAPATGAYSMSYDAAGRLGLLTTFVEPATGTHSFVYDSLGKLTSDANENGTQTLARVDFTNRYRVTHTDAAGVASSYDVIGLPSGDTRQLSTYAAVGRPDTTVFHPEGGSDSFLSDGTWIRDRKTPEPRFGGASNFTGNLLLTAAIQTLVTRARGVTLGVTGDFLIPQKVADTVVVGVGANLTRTLSIYDAPTRTLMTESGTGKRDSLFFDALGRTIRVKPRGGLTSTTLAYDALGRVSATTHGGRLTRFTYDAAGMIDTVVDPLNFRTRFQYDSAGRTTQITQPDGQHISLAYDSFGRLSFVVPPGRPQHQFAYTPGGLIETYTPPSVAGVPDPATRYAYDAAQRITSVRRPSGDSLIFAYDAAGRPATLRFAEGIITRTYHPTTGKPTGMTSTAGGGQNLAISFSTVFLAGMTQSGQVGGGVSFAYDVFYRLVSTSTGPFTDEMVTFQYDRDNFLTVAGVLGITRAAGTGLITGTTFGNLTTTLTHDTLASVISETADRAGTTLYTYSLTRDALDRITTKTETILGVQADWAFAYDSAGRLKQVTRDGAVAAAYLYDANGNRLSRTAPSGTESGTYDDQDRVLTYAGATYLHDASGVLTHKVAGTDTTRYTYDALGALRAARLPNGTQIDYVIDPLGRRVGRKVNGAFTNRWVYESDLRIAAEVNAAGQTITRYAYGTRPNVPEYMRTGGANYRIITDHLGSVRLVVRASDGFVAQRIDYDEFGRVTLNTNPGFQPFGYAGGLYDDATGLVRFGMRDYDPSFAQWTAPDPIGFESGAANRYEYAATDPVNFVDPTGLCPLQAGTAERARKAAQAQPGVPVIAIGGSVIAAPGQGPSVSAGVILVSSEGPGFYMSGGYHTGIAMSGAADLTITPNLSQFQGRSDQVCVGGSVSACGTWNASGFGGVASVSGRVGFPATFTIGTTHTRTFTLHDLSRAARNARDSMKEWAKPAVQILSGAPRRW